MLKSLKYFKWEKTLQFITIIGLSQIIMETRCFLSLVRLGVQAFSWAAGKLVNNRIGLPTSPSSSDVQNHVL
ncbi:hypothetical protein POTOM_059807 [Populus tomentosa]|uniref:Uncharacterized protein n=1 Tax=Populus tomentosa TaxID=118781 RepID=A0A8X7XU61_POPTO|nr:hypothetical protein POTOM_059807 [Populus tomentosa]